MFPSAPPRSATTSLRPDCIFIYVLYDSTVACAIYTLLGWGPPTGQQGRFITRHTLKENQLTSTRSLSIGPQGWGAWTSSRSTLECGLAGSCVGVVQAATVALSS